MKKLISAFAIVAMLTISSAALAQDPVDNVNAKRHPNIAAAQRLTSQAFQRLIVAQQANEFDMNGHAQQAKDLLDQANNQLKLAAEAANANGPRR